MQEFAKRHMTRSEPSESSGGSRSEPGVFTRNTGDLLCLSHLRWGFVFQRPNHLMARFARGGRVFFVEEPVFEGRSDPTLECKRVNPEGVYVCVPRLPLSMSKTSAPKAQRALLKKLCVTAKLQPDVLWFYTPMALPWARDIKARATVYDCMDELTGFLGAPADLEALERELFRRADLVFTGGPSLFSAKRKLHEHVHCFPSSVDIAHFARARQELAEPDDQVRIPHPRLGYFGVIDERIDLGLLQELALARPEFHLVMVGPVTKIDPDRLPQAPNIHWLGMKSYRDLPAYVAGWDVALMPFALNAATRFISPTKTLEYLAGGKAVVSTAIADVVEPYGELGLVRIGDRSSFASQVDAALGPSGAPPSAVLERHLASTSWDRTWESMAALIERRVVGKQGASFEAKCSTI